MSSEYFALNWLKSRLAKHLGGDFFLRVREEQNSVLTVEVWGMLGDIPKFIDDVRINLQTYEALKDFSSKEIETFKAERYWISGRKTWDYDQAMVDLLDDLWTRTLFALPEIIREIREKHLFAAVKNIVTKQEWWLLSKYKKQVDVVSITKSDSLQQYVSKHVLDIGEEQTIALLATGICVLREKPVSSAIINSAIEGYETVMTETYRAFNVETEEFNRDLMKLNSDVIDVLQIKTLPEKNARTVVWGLMSRLGREILADRFRSYVARYPQLL